MFREFFSVILTIPYSIPPVRWLIRKIFRTNTYKVVWFRVSMRTPIKPTSMPVRAKRFRIQDDGYGAYDRMQQLGATLQPAQRDLFERKPLI